MAAEDMKRLEYLWFIGAEFSRLVYCDLGIMAESLRGLGLSPDILNGVITTYDWKYLPDKRNYNNNIPAPDSYVLKPCGEIGTTGKTMKVRYISSPTDTTCAVYHPSLLAPNANAPPEFSDGTASILAFKGSSSIRNWSKNVGAAIPGSVNEKLADSRWGIQEKFDTDIQAATSFLNPILEIFQNILEAIQKVTPNAKHLFIFGHSKGGAECELAGMLFSLIMQKNKAAYPALASLEKITFCSYGAPKILKPASLESFNTQVLVPGVTFWRIESVGRVSQDMVTTLPPWGAHPGSTDGKNTLDAIRKEYGVAPKKDRLGMEEYRRNPGDWPFDDNSMTAYPTLATPYDLWEKSANVTRELQKIVTDAPINVEKTPEETQAGGSGNYVKAKGARDAIFSHVEQFGMYFMGSQRLAGMKNPANTRDKKTFIGEIYVGSANTDVCTSYEYVDWTPANMDFMTQAADMVPQLPQTSVLNRIAMRRTQGGQRRRRRTASKGRRRLRTVRKQRRRSRA